MLSSSPVSTAPTSPALSSGPATATTCCGLRARRAPLGMSHPGRPCRPGHRRRTKEPGGAAAQSAGPTGQPMDGFRPGERGCDEPPAGLGREPVRATRAVVPPGRHLRLTWRAATQTRHAARPAGRGGRRRPQGGRHGGTISPGCCLAGGGGGSGTEAAVTATPTSVTLARKMLFGARCERCGGAAALRLRSRV